MTFWAPNPGKAALKPATTQELLYGTNYNRPQWSRARLEAFFVTTDVTVEVVFKELIKLRLLGMPGPVLRRRFGDKAAARILARDEVRGDAAAGEDRQANAGHGGLTSPGGRFGAAHKDLTAMGVKLANQSGRRQLIRGLAAEFSDGQIAAILNRKRLRTARGLAFTAHRVSNMRHVHGIEIATGGKR